MGRVYPDRDTSATASCRAGSSSTLVTSTTRNTAAAGSQRPRRTGHRRHVGGLGEGRAPAGHAVGESQTEIGERGLGQHEHRHEQRRSAPRDSRRHAGSRWRVMTRHGEAPSAMAAITCSRSRFVTHDGAHAARDARPSEQHEDGGQRRDDGAERQHERQCRPQSHDHVNQRQHEQQVARRGDGALDQPPGIAGPQPQQRAQQQACRRWP